MSRKSTSKSPSHPLLDTRILTDVRVIIEKGETFNPHSKPSPTEKFKGYDEISRRMAKLATPRSAQMDSLIRALPTALFWVFSPSAGENGRADTHWIASIAAIALTVGLGKAVIIDLKISRYVMVSAVGIRKFLMGGCLLL